MIDLEKHVLCDVQRVLLASRVDEADPVHETLIAFHKHLEKDETMVVAQGKIVVKFPNKEVVLSVGEKIQINPGTEYSIVALENATIQEYSTPYPEDTIRIEDKYGRK